MENKVIYRHSTNIPTLKTSHLAGEKQVLLAGNESSSNITQVALGTLQPGESVEVHLHADMEESFYFLQGKGIYRIAGKDYKLELGTYLHIPINTEHYLQALGEEPLHFIYWGIEAQKKAM